MAAQRPPNPAPTMITLIPVFDVEPFVMPLECEEVAWPLADPLVKTASPAIGALTTALRMG